MGELHERVGTRRRPVGARPSNKKSHRAQIVHPVTGAARWSLTARTHGDLAELVARARRIGHDFRTGKLTEQEALAACTLLQTGKPAPSARRVPTVREAWDAYVATIVHPHTRSKAGSVWKILDELVGDELVANLNDARLDTLVANLRRRGYAPKYIRNSIWAFLSAAVRHAKRAKVIAALPWDEFRPPRGRVTRRPSAARTLDDVNAIVRRARVWDENSRARGELDDLARRVIVLVLCGLRNGEGAGLGWDHVDLERGLLTIEHQALDQWRTHWPERTRPDFPTKNAKQRGPLVQRLHPDALAALVEQKGELERRGWYRPDGPVFPTRGGAWRNNANCIYPEDAKALAVEAGISHAARFVTHSYRHTFTSLELLSGGSARATQQRTGHASIAQLEQYAHGGELAPSAIGRLELDSSSGKTNLTEPPT